MRQLKSIEDAVALAKSVGIDFTIHDDMDISTETIGPGELIVIPTAKVPERLASLIQGYPADEFVVLARTEAPPLDEYDLPSDLDPQILQLCKCRHGIINGKSKLLDLINITLEHGTSVVNDIYFFPPEGEYLGYASHHDTVSINVMKI